MFYQPRSIVIVTLLISALGQACGPGHEPDGSIAGVGGAQPLDETSDTRAEPVNLGLWMLDGRELAWDVRGPHAASGLAADTSSEGVCIITQYSSDIRHYANLTRPNHVAYAARHGYFYKGIDVRASGDDFRDPGHPDIIRQDGLYWQSVAAIRHALKSRAPGHDAPQCQTVFWLDADAVFTDFSRSIIDMLLDAGAARGNTLAYSAVLSREQTQVASLTNAGVVVVNNTAGGRAFIDAVYRSYPAYKDEHWPEQQAMGDYALGRLLVSGERANPPSGRVLMRPDIFLVPQRTMNSLYGDCEPSWDLSVRDAWQWQPGDFIAHFAGGKHQARDAARLREMRELANRALTQPEERPSSP